MIITRFKSPDLGSFMYFCMLLQMQVRFRCGLGNFQGGCGRILLFYASLSVARILSGKGLCHGVFFFSKVLHWVSIEYIFLFLFYISSGR